MTMAEIKNRVMFQTNNDPEDIDDFLPHAEDYINDGYDRIINVWAKSHVPSADYPRLTEDEDTPNLPEWIHPYIGDWATWLVYRNGNVQKQQRGYTFRESFERLIATTLEEGGLDGLNEDGTRKQYKNFRNIPA